MCGEPVDNDVELVGPEHKVQFGDKHFEVVLQFRVREIILCVVGVKLETKEVFLISLSEKIIMFEVICYFMHGTGCAMHVICHAIHGNCHCMACMHGTR